MSNLPFGSGGFLAVCLHRLTCHTSACFRSRAHGLVSGQLSRTGHLEEQPYRPGFLLPFGRRPSLLGHPVPARGLGSPYGRLTGTPPGIPDPDGVFMFRPHETRLGLDVLYTPGTAVFPRSRMLHDRRLPHHNGIVPVSPVLHPGPESPADEASSRISG